MRAKLLAGAAVVALTACSVLATAGPASARWYGPGWGAGALAAGVIGGAVAAATSPFWAPGYYGYYGPYGPGPYPGPYYDVAPGPIVAPAPAIAPAGNSVAWCEAHFKSYNPRTGMYLGNDGVHHPCP